MCVKVRFSECNNHKPTQQKPLICSLAIFSAAKLICSVCFKILIWSA